MRLPADNNRVVGFFYRFSAKQKKWPALSDGLKVCGLGLPNRPTLVTMAE